MDEFVFLNAADWNGGVYAGLGHRLDVRQTAGLGTIVNGIGTEAMPFKKARSGRACGSRAAASRSAR
ncbi:MAG: hypothetical protein J6T01_00010 [Kiritimatiellae bacterium]|nr:hypothetical protein [Kiritimatiellia bacterium]